MRPQGHTNAWPKLILAEIPKYIPEASIIDMKPKLILAKINFGQLAQRPRGLADMLSFKTSPFKHAHFLEMLSAWYVDHPVALLRVIFFHSFFFNVFC